MEGEGAYRGPVLPEILTLDEGLLVRGFLAEHAHVVDLARGDRLIDRVGEPCDLIGWHQVLDVDKAVPPERGDVGCNERFVHCPSSGSRFESRALVRARNEFGEITPVAATRLREMR